MKTKQHKGPKLGALVTYIGPTKETYIAVLKYGMSGEVVDFYKHYIVVKFYYDFDYPCILSDLNYENS